MTATALRRLRRSVGAWRAHVGGVAAIEMALTFPILLIGVFFIEEAGRVLYSRVELEQALYHAARYAMVATSAESGAMETVLKSQFVLLSADKVKSFSLSETTNSDKTRNTTLTVSYDVKFIIPLLSLETVTVTRTVSFLRASA